MLIHESEVKQWMLKELKSMKQSSSQSPSDVHDLDHNMTDVGCKLKKMEEELKGEWEWWELYEKNKTKLEEKVVQITTTAQSRSQAQEAKHKELANDFRCQEEVHKEMMEQQIQEI